MGDFVLTEGEAVHYVAWNGRCLCAFVIGYDSITNGVDLVVFTNLLNVNGVKNFGEQYHQDIPYSNEMTPGTWHIRGHGSRVMQGK